jgi:uncharacterized membrane protein
MTDLFNTNTVWFEIALITSIFAIGQIFFAHFEIKTPKWKKLLKILFFIAFSCTISVSFGRLWFFVLLVFLTAFVSFIHIWWLPKHGINGWTAEPREKYYAFRGWKLKE